MYLLHPPGGVVGGDELTIDVGAEDEASGLVTTPAAGKLYRHERRWSSISVTASAGEGATLEWLPQETIAFSGTRARSALAADVHPAGALIAWDILVLGRPAAGEPFAAGAVEQSIEIRREGRPLVLERLRVDPAQRLAEAPWGLAGSVAHGTMVAVAPIGDAAAAAELDLDALRTLPVAPGDRAAVSMLEPGLLVARYLGAGGEAARMYFERVRALVRPTWLGRAAIEPRIWAT